MLPDCVLKNLKSGEIKLLELFDLLTEENLEFKENK